MTELLGEVSDLLERGQAVIEIVKSGMLLRGQDGAGKFTKRTSKY